MGSKVWDFFIIDESDKNKAVCGECNQKIVRGTGKSATTTSLWNHLKHRHPQLCEKQTEEHQANGSTNPRTMKQAKLTSHIGGFGKQWDINNLKSLEIHRLIGEFIALDNQPFSIVEDKGKYK